MGSSGGALAPGPKRRGEAGIKRQDSQLRVIKTRAWLPIAGLTSHF